MVEHHEKQHPKNSIVYDVNGKCAKPTAVAHTVECSLSSTQLNVDSVPCSPSPPATLTQRKLNVRNGQLMPLPANVLSELASLIVTFLCENHVPMRAVETESFKDLLRFVSSYQITTVPNRRVISAKLSQDASAVRNGILAQLRDQNVVLLVDGGTLNRTKVINFSIASRYVREVGNTRVNAFGIFFWKSVAVGERGALSTVLVERIESVSEELRKHDVRVVGMCSDNASNFIAAGNAIMGEGSAMDNSSETEEGDDVFDNEDDDDSNEAEEEEEFEEEEVEEGEEEEEEADEEHDEVVIVSGPEDEGDHAFATEVRDLLTAICAERQKSNKYFVHIRCWAHTFQLILNDLFKLPRLNKLWNRCNDYINMLTPTNEEKIMAAGRAAGESRNLKVIRGCVTRWNSRVEAMMRLYDILPYFRVLSGEIATKDHTALRDDILSVCTILFPICVATQEVQGDGVTMLDALPIIHKLKNSYKRLSEMRWVGRPDLHEMSQRALTCVTNRMRTNFDNMAVRHIEALTPPFIFKESSQAKTALAAQIQSFFTKSIVDANGQLVSTGPSFADICSELNTLASMPVSILSEIVTSSNEDPNAEIKSVLIPSRASAFKRFWTTNRNDLGTVHATLVYIPLYVRMLETLAITEAAVERSFSIQGKVMSGARNRILLETVNSVLMINDDCRRRKRHRAEQQERVSKPQSRVTMTVDDFLCNIAYYRDSTANVGSKPAHMIPVTRTRRAAQVAEEFVFGKSVSVMMPNGRYQRVTVLDPVKGRTGEPSRFMVKAPGQDAFEFDPSSSMWMPVV